ncbi:CBS domain-containing protein [Streptomyces sp. NPDC006529]|uniref:CBS domain-containing protein n=1 Tax=Streptomyces sp. NPDC006529 TaxID=3157177 RepID=UPI0033A570A4
MTLTQTLPPPRFHVADRAPTTAEAMRPCGPQVCDDMTVEVALSVMTSTLTAYLVLCDEDGLCAGLVTRTRLVAFRAGSAYTDRVRLRDLVRDGGPFVTPATPAHDAERVLRDGGFEALPVVDADGHALGVLVAPLF